MVTEMVRTEKKEPKVHLHAEPTEHSTYGNVFNSVRTGVGRGVLLGYADSGHCCTSTRPGAGNALRQGLMYCFKKNTSATSQ